MDLKSMLNDASAQRPPRLHTSQTVYDARANEHKSNHEAHLNRPASYGPPLQPVDSRSQAVLQYGYPSPHQPNVSSASTHASVHSASTHSTYAQSPATVHAHPQTFPSRETTVSHNPYHGPFHPSPVPSHQPLTPGSSQSLQSHASAAHAHPTAQQLTYNRSSSPRGPHPSNGSSIAHNRIISPQTHYHHHQPKTPLGPPINYNRLSPHAQRPPSQGHEQSYRSSSHGSSGSVPSREQSQGRVATESVRSEIAQLHRQPAPEPDLHGADRDRSVSVSPKTIPKLPPQRQPTSSSFSGPQRPLLQHLQETKQRSAPPATVSEQKSDPLYPVADTNILAGQVNSMDSVKGQSAGYASLPAHTLQQTIRQTSSPLSAQLDHAITTPTPTLKRNASLMSDSPGKIHQPRKRLRRSEIPVWAQSARKKPPRFGDGSRRTRVVETVATSQQATQQKPVPGPPTTNGHTASVIEQPVPGPGPGPSPQSRWEPTIANEIPEDDLCQAIGAWVYKHIGNRTAPPGAMFEIEAKIGAIVDNREGARLNLPVWSETIFLKERFGGNTKFESSMNVAQHQLLNKYLNDLVTIAYNDVNREPVRPCHLREYDDFYELSEEGRRNLPPGLRTDGRRQAPRVRTTTDKESGEVRAKIIKSRIADLEIYNPNCDFDFRISISLESPWEGPGTWLDPSATAESRTRLKDRMSYRHAAIQVDLTQVSHGDGQQMQHELEVEVSMPMLQAELDKQRMGLPNRYLDLIKSLIDNTRLLCRKGSEPRLAAS